MIVEIIRWSTDAERDALAAAFMKDENQFAEELRKEPSVGYIWTGGPVGFSIRSAYRLPLAGGGDRIIVVTDRPLNSGGFKDWSTDEPIPHTHPFTMLELHVGRSLGEGKMSLATGVKLDAGTKAVVLDNYASAPVMLKAVRKG